MKEITTKEVEQLIAGGKNINIIDVREVGEAAEGRIKGAVNIPLGLLEGRMPDLDKSKEYILVCRSGGRSGRACQFLNSYGYKVINMAGGMLSWEGKTE
ncbi:rhodanese-like domain-containing protein [Metabacillus fastidiosus]|uniref:rhodanese-like domain-containing protein n=1 Tax=Metabacillus fastidiosus TaxID=1458 RepID=UPI002E1D9363|nr:rhodanese-like domain-containing protein [Metabacillus fastidiosus]